MRDTNLLRMKPPWTPQLAPVANVWLKAHFGTHTVYASASDKYLVSSYPSNTKILGWMGLRLLMVYIHLAGELGQEAVCPKWRPRLASFDQISLIVGRFWPRASPQKFNKCLNLH